jgi:hypothetical protein
MKTVLALLSFLLLLSSDYAIDLPSVLTVDFNTTVESCSHLSSAMYYKPTKFFMLNITSDIHVERATSLLRG